MLRRTLPLGGALLVLLLSVPAAWAQQEERTITEDEIPGDVYVKLNKDYGKVEVDGQLWEDYEFIDNGYTLIVHGLDRSVEHTLRVIPAYDDLAPATVTVQPKDFKKKVKRERRKRIISFVARKSVKFAPKPAEPATGKGGASQAP